MERLANARSCKTGCLEELREVRGCSIRSEGIYFEMQLANSGQTKSQRALQDHSGTYGLDSKNKA